LCHFEASAAIPLHVVVACHNRRDLTVRALTTFAAAATAAGANADFTVFDDGSTDGTAEALAALDLPIVRIPGDGSAFWARSMAEAEDRVLQFYGDDGYVVWLNDDVELDGDSLEVALEAARSVPSAVLVGAMRGDKGELTYSGFRNVGFSPLRGVLVEPNGTLQSLDTCNGNLVLVPMKIARALGGIDGSLMHQGADTEYGMRVREGGFELLLLPRFVGTCALNPVRPLGSVMEDWRAFVGVKGGGNFNNLKQILRKRYPRTWLGYVTITYSHWWARRLSDKAFSAATSPLVRGRRRRGP
jgi:GT2 family glycosyltransferase